MRASTARTARTARCAALAIVTALVSVLVSLASVAHADPAPPQHAKRAGVPPVTSPDAIDGAPRDVAAGPKKAAPIRPVDVGTSFGMVQGLGSPLGTARTPPSSRGALIGVHAGPRLRPRWSLVWQGEFFALAESGDTPEERTASSDLHGVSTGIAVTYHTNPRAVLCPWISLGPGYRLIWVSPAGPDNNASVHGFEPIRARFGLELRLAGRLAIGPVLGVDLTYLNQENPEGIAVDRRIEDAQLAVFMHAALAARFDFGGD